MVKPFLLFCLLTGLALTVWAQELPATTEQKLEELSAHSDNDIEDDSYWQNLEYAKRHPVNINTATKEDLQAFKFLTDLQIDHLLQYRQLLGNILSAYELQAVPGWDLTTISQVLPFISVATYGGLLPFAERFRQGDHSLLLRESKVLQQAKGYRADLSNHYLGTNDHLFIWYKYRFRNQLQYGIVADKGPGEPFFAGSNRHGFDFYSAHFFVRNLGHIKAIALGDFTVNMGQGLIQWQSLAFKKSADVMAIKRQAPVLLPYNLAGEYYFHRGAGLTVQKGRVEATGFISYKPITAPTTYDSAWQQSVATSFLALGYHRTESELHNKNSMDQLTAGGNLRYHTQSVSIGVNAIQYQFSLPLQKREEAYNLYAIRGRQWSNASIDYSYTYNNMHAFGEAAMDKRGHTAFMNGLLVSAAPAVDLSFLYRHIDKAYQSLYSNAFTENGVPTNESGFYMGILIRPVAGWKLAAYADFYRFPWLKYRVDAPTSGHDYVVQATYQPNKVWEAYIRYKSEVKADNQAFGLANVPVGVPKQNMRAHLTYRFSNRLSLRSRAEGIWLKTPVAVEKGYLGYIEGVFKPLNPIAIAVRCQYFTTDSYDTRIYAYEQDVLYSYSIPFFYNKGVRYYINLHYAVDKRLSLWARWASTIYTNKEVIGSGLDAISGHTKTDIKLQLRYLFR